MLHPWLSAHPSLRGEGRRQEEVSKARGLTDTSSLHCYTSWIPGSGSGACSCVSLCLYNTLQSCFLVNSLFKPVSAPNGAPSLGCYQTSSDRSRQHRTIHTITIQTPLSPSPGCSKLSDQHNCFDSVQRTGNKGEAEFLCGLIARVCRQNSSLQRDLSVGTRKGRRQETLVMLQDHANQPHRQTLLFKKKRGINSERLMRGPSAHLWLVLFQGELPSATIIEK